MKKVAVLGGTGMAGHVVSTYLEEIGYDIYITSRSANNSFKSLAIDATDFPRLGSWLDEVKPDVVVNCIGVLKEQSDERPDLAILLNAYLPKWLERKYAGTASRLIHLSTDCVFSGNKGGYTETDIPDGPTVYDRSKALGEVVNKKDLTFRMSIIGPDRHENGNGLFNWFMKQKGSIRGFRKAIWNGVTTIELAHAIDEAIKQNLNGLYQLTPQTPIDKYNLLLLFQGVFGKTDVQVEPYDGFSVDKTLINTRKDFDFTIQKYPQQIADMKAWVDGHNDLYGAGYANI